MKTFFSILITFILALTTHLEANELGKRYIKLGNTYRESGNFEKAEEYLMQGKAMVSRDTYWSATANEYLGYLYRDMVSSGRYDDNTEYFSALAKEHLEQALAGFRKSVRQNDGSPAALNNLGQHQQEDESSADNGEEGKNETQSTPTTTNAKIVNYDNSKLKEIPRDISSKVENFSAAGNRITTIGSSFVPAKNLKYLQLKNNRLRSLDGSIGSLKKLKVLNVSGNKLKSIPQEIRELKDLEILDVSHNKLTEIPVSITSLKRLKVLDLSGNKIPFSRIATILKSMPTTNILYDRYELVDDEEEELDNPENSGAIQGK